MNITLLIGNGFDIALGLDTTYRSFLEQYISLPSANTEIQKFKERLKREMEEDDKSLGGTHYGKWADCEAAKGIDTVHYDDPTEYLMCWDDLFSELTGYLGRQSSRLKAEAKDELVPRLGQDLVSMHSSLGSKDADVVTGHPDYFHRYNVTVNVVSFNYTRCFDILFRTLMRSKSFHNWSEGSHVLYTRAGKIVHPHGTLAGGNLVFGVNDPSQVQNQTLLEDPSVSVDLIKSNACEVCKSYQKDEAIDLLDESDLIYIFGMSIGDSDKEWWERIGHWLVEDSSRLLILHVHQNVTSDLPIHKQFSAERRARKRFLDQTGLSEEQRDQIAPRVLISFDASIFNYGQIAEEYIKPLA